MYGLPRDFDGMRPIGRSLEQICFNQNQIALHFDESLTIVVESALSYHALPDLEGRLIEVPVLQSDLMRLLGHSIVKAFGDEKGTLTMEFSNSHILKCLDTSRNYESYRIVQGNDELIV